MKVLISGAGGQLGQALLATAPSRVQAVAAARGQFDITAADSVARGLEDHEPQAVINAAAYTAVDRAEDEEAQAYRVNAEAPGVLASACAARQIRLLHVSTDFVFDGQRSDPYPPDARAAPLGVYGASKLAGERRVLDSAADALILRTAWVYSAGPGNFLHTMLRLHRERDELRVVADQVGAPTAADSLALALWAAAARAQLNGVYHWSDAGVCSWYDFAVAIGEEAQNLGLLSEPAAVHPIRSDEYPTRARRPAYSVLDKTAAWRDFELTPIHWRQQLRATLKQIGKSTHG